MTKLTKNHLLRNAFNYLVRLREQVEYNRISFEQFKKALKEIEIKYHDSFVKQLMNTDEEPIPENQEE